MFLLVVASERVVCAVVDVGSDVIVSFCCVALVPVGDDDDDVAVVAVAVVDRS